MLFVCEYIENRINYTETIEAESHQDAAQAIKSSHPGITYVSAMLLSDYENFSRQEDHK